MGGPAATGASGRPGLPAGGPARWALVGAVVLVLVVGWWLRGAGGSAPTAAPGPTASRVATGAGSSAGSSAASSVGVVAPAPGGAPTGVQAKARAVLQVVDATGRAPTGYVGGRQFMNDGRGGTAALPRRGADGRAVIYHEYDVNPYRTGVDRGPERLVVGSDRSAFCTADHYVTWQRLR